jgi:hypothetical protein
MLFRFCFLFSLLFVPAATADTWEQVLEWVRSHGGYWNPKQELRFDDDGMFGVFASQDIEEDEVLNSLPWDVIITADTSNHRFQNCDTVQVLEEKMEDKGLSLYAQSLRETAQRHFKLLPANWSPEGQALLNQVIGNGALPPEDAFMRNFAWKHECDKVDKTAALLSITHFEDFGMVPIVHNYNHRGGQYTGAYFSIQGGDEVALETRALRYIEKGEQIYTDYKDDEPYGTPELLRDYGFVEQYPQRWVFHKQQIAFDIDQAEDNLEVTWLHEIQGKRYHARTEQVTDFLREHLNRLRNHVYPEIQRTENERALPEHELKLISYFCRDLMAALSRAIDDSCPAAED